MANLNISLTVSISVKYPWLVTNKLAEDILSEKLGGEDILGLDHPNKNRSAWNRVDQIFIR